MKTKQLQLVIEKMDYLVNDCGDEIKPQFRQDKQFIKLYERLGKLINQ